METKQIDRTDEKVKLARELGVQGYIDFVSSLNLTFKIITRDEISKKIGAGRIIYKPSFSLKIISVALTLLIINIFLNILFINVFIKELWVITNVFTTIIIGLCVLNCLFKRVSMDSSFISYWQGNIPYGALLAMKEAKEQRLEGFRIWYPTIKDQIQKDDPVITARDAQGNLREIFAWDDGKIYE